MNLICSLWFGLLLLSSGTFATDIKIANLSFKNLEKIINEHITNNPGVMDVANKDIVALLGYTGSGKSTLLNFLSKQELISDELSGLKLVDPNATMSFTIGDGGQSQTRLPQSFLLGDLHYYDFAGIADNRGTVQNLVNACLIKRILEHARSVRIIIVTSHSDVTSVRGAGFRELLNNLRKITNKNLEAHSLIVMTRSPFKERRKLGHFLMKFIGDEAFTFVEHEKISLMLNPDLQDELPELFDWWRDDILEKTRHLEATKIERVEVESFYTAPHKEDLNRVFSEQLRLILHQFVLEASQWSNHTSAQLRYHGQRIEQTFMRDLEDKFAQANLVLLLKPLAERAYNKAGEAIASEIELRRQNLIKAINEALANKITEEKRLEAARLEQVRLENEKRVAQERQRQLILQKQEQERLQRVRIENEKRAAQERQRQLILQKQEQERLQRVRIENEKRAAEEYSRKEEQRQKAEEKREKEQKIYYAKLREESLKDPKNWNRKWESRRVAAGPVMQGNTVYDSRLGRDRPTYNRMMRAESREVYTHPDNPALIAYGSWLLDSTWSDSW